MDSKFEYDVYSKKENACVDYIFEIQVMDSYSYQDLSMRYARDIKSKDYFSELIKHMIVKPSEARDIKFWKDDEEARDVFIDMLDKYQKDFYRLPVKRKGFRKIET